MFTATRDKAAGTAETMTNEDGPTLHDVKETAQRFKGEAREAAHAMKEDLEDAARKTGRHMRDLADSAGHGVTDVTSSVSARIRDNPVQSSLIALAAGFFFGVLYRR